MYPPFGGCYAPPILSRALSGGQIVPSIDGAIPPPDPAAECSAAQRQHHAVPPIGGMTPPPRRGGGTPCPQVQGCRRMPDCRRASGHRRNGRVTKAALCRAANRQHGAMPEPRRQKTAPYQQAPLRWPEPLRSILPALTVPELGSEHELKEGHRDEVQLTQTCSCRRGIWRLSYCSACIIVLDSEPPPLAGVGQSMHGRAQK